MSEEETRILIAKVIGVNAHGVSRSSREGELRWVEVQKAIATCPRAKIWSLEQIKNRWNSLFYRYRQACDRCAMSGGAASKVVAYVSAFIHPFYLQFEYKSLMDDLLANDPRANPQALLQTPPGGLPMKPLTPQAKNETRFGKQHARDSDLERSFARIADALCSPPPAPTMPEHSDKLREREINMAEDAQRRKHDREDLDLLLQAKRAKQDGDEFTYQAILLASPGVRSLLEKVSSFDFKK